MSLKKTWVVLLKETRHILHDPATLILLLLAPVLLLIVWSYALVTDIRETPITVIDNSRTPFSCEFLNTLANSNDIVVDELAAAVNFFLLSVG